MRSETIEVKDIEAKRSRSKSKLKRFDLDINTYKEEEIEMERKIWLSLNGQQIVTFQRLDKEAQFKMLNLGYAPALDIFWQDGQLAVNLDCMRGDRVA